VKDELADRRAFGRVPFRVDTTVRTRDRTIRSSSTLDISMNGLRISIREAAPPAGTPCEITIMLSGGRPAAVFEARGSIVRSEHGTLAVHLTEMDLDSYQHLRQIVINNALDPERAEREISERKGIRSSRRSPGT
jgi:hypothetical protein